MLREKAVSYYFDAGKSCSESILMAANDVYELGLGERETALFAGFRGGMGCGSTCGCISGAVGALSCKYAGREDLRDLCARFVAAFEKKLGSTFCSELEPKYKTEAQRCSAAVALAAEVLAAFVDEIDGEEFVILPEELKEELKKIQPLERVMLNEVV